MATSPKSLLVVEDDENLLGLYVQLLQSEQYTVDSSGNGLDALEKMKKGGYDMVLLDIMLPGMDGLQILDELHKKAPVSPIGSIVLLTNLAQNDTIARALKNGVAGYIIKSRYSPEDFLAEVKKLLDAQPTH